MKRLLLACLLLVSTSVSADPNAVSGTKNLGLSASVSSSTLTVALKGSDGNDPSGTNQVSALFRNVNPQSGVPTEHVYQSALSATLPSGATVGTISGVPARLYWGLLDVPEISLSQLVTFNTQGTDGLCALPLETQRHAVFALNTASDSACALYGTSAIGPQEQNFWRGIAYGGGVWVGVCGAGSNRVMRSTDDGVTWTPVSIAANQWEDVKYGNGVFVAVSSDGSNRVARSTDGGATWSAVAAADANTWRKLAYGNATWVAVASDGTNRTMRSTDDGATWSAFAAGENNQWVGVAFGNNTFVAVAIDGTHRVMRSTDNGASWSPITAAEANSWISIAYGNTVFIAVADTGTNRTMRSTDSGASWAAVGAPESDRYHGIAYGNSVWIITGETALSRVARSTDDGQTWTSIPSAEGNRWHSVAYGNGYFLSLSEDGTHRAQRSSDDGQTWAVLPPSTIRWIGYTDSIQLNAGAWVSKPYGVQLLTASIPKSGDIVRRIVGTHSTMNTRDVSSYADTGLSAQVVLSNPVHRVLVHINHTSGNKWSTNTSLNVKLVRLNEATSVTDTLATALSIGNIYNANQSDFAGPQFLYWDAPGIQSPLTYKTQFASSANTGTVSVQSNNSPSTIILEEIAP